MVPPWSAEGEKRVRVGVGEAPRIAWAGVQCLQQQLQYAEGHRKMCLRCILFSRAATTTLWAMSTLRAPHCTEKRRAHRIAVPLTVELESASGVTRDVSALGVFFEMDRSFLPGAPITFSLLLEHGALDGPLRLHCQGQVVRVERRRAKTGVAVSIAAVRFDPIVQSPPLHPSRHSMRAE